MDELQELYQQVIIDHNKNPRNYGKPAQHNHFAEGYNPLCGDRINIYLDIDNNVIRDIHFDGQGCAISKSSASIMTSILKGKTLEEVEELFGKFHDLITGPIGVKAVADDYGKLAVFEGVKAFPSRVKCASLAWHTMKNAIENKNEIAVTE